MTNTMTANTITIERIESLHIIVQQAEAVIMQNLAEIQFGQVTPEDAAADINEAIQNIIAANS